MGILSSFENIFWITYVLWTAQVETVDWVGAAAAVVVVAGVATEDVLLAAAWADTEEATKEVARNPKTANFMFIVAKKEPKKNIERKEKEAKKREIKQKGSL